jgi:tetratricopeptide (TPR) repeat protein
MLPVPLAFEMAVRNHKEGQLQLAGQLYRQILQTEPQHAGALHFIGLIAYQLGDNDQAIDYMTQALRINPDLAEAHNNLGNVLLKLGRKTEAVESYRQAVRLTPDHAEGHYNLGLALGELGQEDEAIAANERAVRLNPNYAPAHNNLGILFKEQGRLDEAVASYYRCLRLQPNNPEAQYNLAGALVFQGKVEEGAAWFQEAIRLRPDLAEAHQNLGMTLLMLGNFQQGWPEYEWRLRCKEGGYVNLPQPNWDGSPLEGKTILLHAEQGMGDTLQFVRYARLVKERGGRVLQSCPPSLQRVLARCAGIDRLVPFGEPWPEFDVQARLLSLPYLLGTNSIEKIPATVPYLEPDAEMVRHWRGRLDEVPGFRVGIVWKGNAAHRRDRWRSVPLAEFAPLAKIDKVSLISLQYGKEQLAEMPGLALDWGALLSEDLADLASILPSLDLVISVDTAVVHLAGALGVKVWVPLPFAPDWRWLLGRSDSPWYPSVRLFRQSRQGKWEEVFEQIAGELKKLAFVRKAEVEKD